MKWVKSILPWKSERDCCTFWWEGNWEDICCQHDVDYRYRPDGISKFRADWELKKGVEASGHACMAWVMWAGVSTFGWIPWIKHRIFPPRSA